jgi:hypothetical protein
MLCKECSVIIPKSLFCRKKLFFMKKLVIALLALLCVFIGFAYLFVPAVLKVNVEKKMVANLNAANRFLAKPAEWVKALPNASLNNQTISWDEQELTIGEPIFNGRTIDWNNASVRNKTILVMVNTHKDSIQLNWTTSFQNSKNPFARVANYFKVKNLASKMSAAAAALANHWGNWEKMYGLKVEFTKIKNDNMMGAKLQTAQYPDYATIYGLIEQVQLHVRSQQATIIDSPMLNIDWLPDLKKYQTYIAIPIDQELSNNGQFVFKKMFKGNALHANLMGGDSSIQKGLQTIQQFYEDFQLTSPAIPFQVLSTNRLATKDSAQWKTDLYYPIF